MYYVIQNLDGETLISKYTKEKLISDLSEEEAFGENPVFLDVDKSEEFNINPNYWPENSYLIIKGEIVTPKPKDIVKSFDIT